MSERLAGYELLGKGGFACSSLWLGEDHLLYVEGHGFLLSVRERYRRFAYADIESVSLAKNSVGAVVALVLAVMTLGAAGCLVAVVREGIDDIPGRVSAAVAAIVLLAGLVLLIRHAMRGPCCVCEMTTRAGRVRPRPLRRLRTARPAVARLEEKVRAVPGDERRHSGSTFDPVRRRTPAMAMPAFVANAVLALWLAAVIGLGWSGTGAAAVTSLLSFVAVLLLLLAVAAMTRRPAPSEPALLLVSLFAPLLLLGGGALTCFAVFAARQQEMFSGTFGLAQLFGKVSDLAPSSVVSFFTIVCSGMAVIAIGGMWFAGRAAPEAGSKTPGPQRRTKSELTEAGSS